MGLSVKIGNTILKNPVCVASGTFGYADEYKCFINNNNLGAIFTKAITKEPRAGNLHPRIVETECGMLNAIGLANVGVEAFLKYKIPMLKKHKTAVFVNVAGSTTNDYEYVVEYLSHEKAIEGFEINISCPNVKHGGMSFGADSKATFALLNKLRKLTNKTLIAKLSPNVTDITIIAQAAKDAGCDGISLINTLVGMAIDIKTRQPRLSNITGGLSGPAIKPIGIAMVYKVRCKMDLPIIGIGGIINANDAIEYLIAGASAIQIGTGLFVNPKTTQEVLTGITDYIKNNNIKSISNLTGALVL